ncbi:MAG: IPExxxVDY family protein [Bacteroidales bacterium]|nr:IPExxxVDY family protein [Bacteroidales bacterium]
MKAENPKKRRNLKLDVRYDLNFKLIGIISHENDYRLVWAMNSSMKFKFVRSGDLVTHQAKLKHDISFSCFIHNDEERYVNYHLISNRGPEGFLFPEFRNIDFFLQIVGEPEEKTVEQIIKALRRIDIISGAYLIDPLKLKDVSKIMTA